jgi:DNA-binding NtrC family response regulator
MVSGNLAAAIAEAAAARAGDDEPAVLLGSSAAALRLHDDIRSAAGSRCALVEGDAGLDLEEVACAVHRRSGRGGTCIRLAASGGDDGDTMLLALSRAGGGSVVIVELQQFSPAAQRRLLQAARADTSGAPSLIAVMSLAGDGAESQVRRDLIRCLGQARITVPALRQRREDIPDMAATLTAAACEQAGVPRKTLTRDAQAVIAAMPWRQNLAELRQALDRLVRVTTLSEIGPADVLAQVRFDAAAGPAAPQRTLRAARRQFEREYICDVLRRHDGRVGDAARVLGMQRTNLYRKARQLGITVTRPEQA